jgi:flagellar basal-body rod protein FlgG
MFRALRTAALGMSSQQLSVDNIANNLANVNTVGFKRATIAFQDLFYQTMSASKRGSTTSGSNVDAPELQIGHGSRAAGTIRNFGQGSIQQTGNALDLAVNGIGFFQILRPDNTIAYTRDGNFNLSADGMIVNASGLPLADQIQIPPDVVSVQITQDGTVLATMQGETNAVTLGQIELVKFVNPAGLRAVGDNMYEMTDASGDPFIGSPGMEGFGLIQQGFVEQSNVDIVNEMVNLITAQRAYETNSKMVITAEEMMQLANQIKR